MTEEYTSLIKNRTWSLTELPPNHFAVDCKWTFKYKYNPDRSVARYKARFIAKGYSQHPRIDFFETYSPVECSAQGCHTDVFRRTDGRLDDGRGGVHDLDAL
jgi:hypothetical protein